MNIDPNVGKRHTTRSGTRHYKIARFDNKDAKLTGNFARDNHEVEFAEYCVGDQKLKRWSDTYGNWQPFYFTPVPEGVWQEPIEWIEL